MTFESPNKKYFAAPPRRALQNLSLIKFDL